MFGNIRRDNVRNKDILSIVSVVSIKRSEKIVYDNLVIYNINLQMHQFDKWSLSMQDKLKKEETTKKIWMNVVQNDTDTKDLIDDILLDRNEW